MAGHSAGGQFVTRYEMANQIHDTLGVPMTYVVANPSSYAYLDAPRPNGEKATLQRFQRRPQLHYLRPLALRIGESDRLHGERSSDDQLKKQLASRPTTYLLGEIDILPLGGFDSLVSGDGARPTRRARGEAFAKYVNEKYGAQHKVQLCSAVRPQRAVHVHVRRGAGDSVPEAVGWTRGIIKSTDAFPGNAAWPL